MIRKGNEVIAANKKQIEDFQKGDIQPLGTDIDYLDPHLLGGFYPSTKLGIVAPSNQGKTYELNKIQASLEKKYKDVIFLKCMWEIPLFKTLIRDMAEEAKITVREVLENTPNAEIQKKFDEIYNRYESENMFLETEAVAPEEFYKDCLWLINTFPDKKLVVSIDNLENVLPKDRSHKQAMDDVVRYINLLEKKHSFIVFIILNQMNRSIEEREKPQNHFPREGDIFNSSAFFKLCDVVMVKYMPYRMGIKKYGVFSKKRYCYGDLDSFKSGSKGNTDSFDAEGVVFRHFLKSRDIPLEFDRQDLYAERLYEKPVEENQFEEAGWEGL